MSNLSDVIPLSHHSVTSENFAWKCCCCPEYRRHIYSICNSFHYCYMFKIGEYTQKKTSLHTVSITYYNSWLKPRLYYLHSRYFQGISATLFFYSRIYYWIFYSKLVSLWDQDLESIQAINRFSEKCTNKQFSC